MMDIEVATMLRHVLCIGLPTSGTAVAIAHQYGHNAIDPGSVLMGIPMISMPYWLFSGLDLAQPVSLCSMAFLVVIPLGCHSLTAATWRYADASECAHNGAMVYAKFTANLTIGFALNLVSALYGGLKHLANLRFNPSLVFAPTIFPCAFFRSAGKYPSQPSLLYAAFLAAYRACECGCIVVTNTRAKLSFAFPVAVNKEQLAATFAYYSDLFSHNKTLLVQGVLAAIIAGAGSLPVAGFSGRLIRPFLSPPTFYHRKAGV